MLRSRLRDNRPEIPRRLSQTRCEHCSGAEGAPESMPGYSCLHPSATHYPRSSPCEGAKVRLYLPLAAGTLRGLGFPLYMLADARVA